ncbi:redoxin domain-containing protein [bacterium]|nr:redoxin domain-containing protein [bacterium]
MKKIFASIILFSASIMLFSMKSNGVKVGDAAPDFSLKNVDGKMVSLSDYADKKGVIVIFTCNHCPYAKLYEDRIKALDVKYSPKGWPVVAINPNDPAIEPDDSYERMQEVATEHGYTFPYLFDEKQEVFPKYGATRTPHVFLLQNGKKGFEVAYIGAIDNNAKDTNAADEKFVENAIEALMAGKKVSTKETAAIGCSIKVGK